MERRIPTSLEGGADPPQSFGRMRWASICTVGVAETKMHVGVDKVLLLTTLVLGVIASCSNLWTERTELASAAIWGERAPGEVTEWDMFGGDSDLKRHAAPNGPRAKPRHHPLSISATN